MHWTWARWACSPLEMVGEAWAVRRLDAALVLLAGGAARRVAALVLDRVLLAGAVGGTAGGGRLVR